MPNFFRDNKKINFDPYIPEYTKDEEIYDFMKVFEEFLNELYVEEKEQNYKNLWTSVSENKPTLDDTSPIMYNYGYRQPGFTSDTDTPPTDKKWSYKQGIPTMDQLKPGVGTDPTKINYPFTVIQNLGYLNSTLPQTVWAEFYYPWKGSELGEKIPTWFDYRAPLEIQNVPAKLGNPNTVVYNQIGLYDARAKKTRDNEKIPGYTEYYRSGYREDSVDIPVLVDGVRTGSNPIYYQPELINKENGTTKVMSKVGVLEKIARIVDLKDPRLMDFKYIQYFADYLGWDMSLTLEDFSSMDIYAEKYGSLMTEDEKQEAVMTHIRSFIENVPWWYRIKGTESAILIILYTFGLVADIIKYYTGDYSTNYNNWATADTFFNEAFYETKAVQRNETLEDFTDIPDEWFPTPHFQIRYSINDSFSGYTKIFYEAERFQKLISAIDAVKPVTTVFEGLVSLFRTKHEYMTTIYSIYVPFVSTRTTDGGSKTDAYGTLEERDKYNKMPVGFTYLAVGIDSMCPVI